MRRSGGHEERRIVAMVHAKILLRWKGIGRDAVEEIPRILDHRSLWEGWEIMIGRGVGLR